MQIFYHKTTLQDTVMVIFSQVETTHIVQKDDCVQLFHHQQVVGYNFLNASKHFKASLANKDVSLETLQANCYASNCLQTGNTELIDELNEMLTKYQFKTIEATQKSDLIVGEVLECQKHPDSQKLNICTVDIETALLQIVCGAINVRAGIKVVVATNHAILYNGVEIKLGKILGIDSQGMLCSAKELGIFNHSQTQGILELPLETFKKGQEFKVF